MDGQNRSWARKTWCGFGSRYGNHTILVASEGLPASGHLQIHDGNGLKIFRTSTNKPLMIPRILEPEVMASAKEAVEYDRMDHSEVNRRFVEDLMQFWQPESREGTCRILDVGTGTALIPIELCTRLEQVKVIAVDLSPEMVALARRNVEAVGLSKRIEIRKVDAKALPEADECFDAVMSNSIVHHIPDPFPVMRECLRVLKPNGCLFFRDLMRPESEERLECLVDQYAGEETEYARQLFRQSLHAALRLPELRHIMARLGVDASAMQASSDRHWTLALRKPAAGA